MAARAQLGEEEAAEDEKGERRREERGENLNGFQERASRPGSISKRPFEQSSTR